MQTVPRLQERAQALGYRVATPNDIEHIPVPDYDPTTIEEIFVTNQDMMVDDVPQYDATFAGWIQQNWDRLVNEFRAFGR
ncbi:MAG: hypothetical protein AAFV93_02640 [Chloroflexota bacterium]